MDKITTINKLVANYYRKNPNGHFFDRETLKFFGERISDMYLFKQPVTVRTYTGEMVQAYKISRLQRNHPGGARRTYAYFKIDTLEDIII